MVKSMFQSQRYCKIELYPIIIFARETFGDLQEWSRLANFAAYEVVETYHRTDFDDSRGSVG